MPRAYANIAFTPSVKAWQEKLGSRAAYARQEGESEPERFGERERTFIEARDGFYLSSVSEDGWPYVQFRGGPPGFLRVVDDRTLRYIDLEGNKQYLSMGNISKNDRVCLFFMDYAHKRRLKVWGRAKVDVSEDGQRAVAITLEAYDWNCSQHIPRRLTVEEWNSL